MHCVSEMEICFRLAGFIYLLFRFINSTFSQWCHKEENYCRKRFTRFFFIGAILDRWCSPGWSDIIIANSAVGVDLDPQRLNKVRPVSSPRKICQLELDLISPFIQPHRQCAFERLHPGCRLVIARTESATQVVVIKNLHHRRKKNESEPPNQ